MKVIIEEIPHKEQRYNTVGDWQYHDDTLQIKVSKSDPRSTILVAIHELIEAVLCLDAGISAEEVDEFDLDFQYGEPGEHKDCPYRIQHTIASVVENIVMTAMNYPQIVHETSLQILTDNYEKG
jgi:hypothetical protein